MADRVNTRPYDATRRQEAARARRARVVEAARELLEHQGFAATTVVAVAARAGVSPESIYKGFGSKAELVKAVLDVALAGDDAPVAVADREENLALRQEPDTAAKLRGFARGAVARQVRSAKVQLVLRNGAGADPAIEALWARLQGERLTGMTMFARHLAATTGLRIPVEQARDVLWTYVAVEVYDLLVLQRGWSAADYERWLADALVSALT